MLQKLTLFLAPLCISACAHQPVQPLQIQASTQLPALAAEYETIVTEFGPHDEDKHESTYRWRFWRTADRVETHNLQDNTGEIWDKTADGNIGYQRVFHDQQQVIDYLPGDLKAIGSTFDWAGLATLLNQSMLNPLQGGERMEIMGHAALRYQNRDSDQPLEVIWLEHEQLPALIKHSEHGHTIVTRIQALYPLAQSPWPYQHVANYNITDFADIGDKENDPVIKSILPKLKGSHRHPH